MKKLNNKGFTLVELIVVIAILGVLMAVLVPQYIQYVEKSRVSTDESAIGEVIHAAEISIADGSVYDDLPAATFCITVTNGQVAISGAIKYVTTSAGVTTLTVPTESPNDGSKLIDAMSKAAPAPQFKSKTHKATATDTYTIVVTANTNGYTVSPYTSNTGSATAAGWY